MNYLSENEETRHSYDPKILGEVMKNMNMNMNNGITATADNNEHEHAHDHNHMDMNKNIMGMNDDMHMNMDDDTSSNKSDNDFVFCTPGMMMAMPMSPNQMHSSTGTIMYMDGFHMTMSGGHQCLNLYFPTWTLNTRPKFLGACAGILLLSFLTEGLSKLRYKITASSKSARSSNRRRNQQQNNNNETTITPPEEVIRTTSDWINKCTDFFIGLNKRLLHLMISVLHGVQALLGYVLMLAGMTFSIELLLSVIIGLGIGYAVFFSNDADFENHVTTNPCCNYMQDEANEIPTQKNNNNIEDDNTSMGSEEDDIRMMINNSIEQQQQQQSAEIATAIENSSNVV